MKIYEDKNIKKGYSGYTIWDNVLADSFFVRHETASIADRCFDGTYEECLNYINIMNDNNMHSYHSYIKKFVRCQHDLDILFMEGELA